MVQNRPHLVDELAVLIQPGDAFLRAVIPSELCGQPSWQARGQPHRSGTQRLLVG